jgi:fatty-acyl-CoA synthase
VSLTADPVVGEWLDRHLQHAADRLAVIGADRELTYADLETDAAALARGLVAHGAAPGDVVAVLSENLADVVVLLFACAKAACLLAPLNWRLTPDELRPYIELIDPRLLLASDAHMPLAAASVAHAAGPLPLAETIERLGSETAAGLPAVQPDDGLMLVATSGSTGRPKAAVLTHGNFLGTNRALDGVVPIGSDDVVLQFMPQFHVGGWNVQPMQAWMNGATVVLEPTFDAGHVLGEIERRGVTTLACVPTSLLLLAEHPRFASTDLTGLRDVVVGGAAASEQVVEQWMGRGVAVQQGYGLTEAGPNVLCLPARFARDRPRAVGWPYPSVEVALADVDTGAIVDGASSGEVLVRGPGVFPGYWKDPGATAEALDGGWLHTGDVASRDGDGCYTIVGRKKEMFVSGGENVFPIEVERAISTYPGVAGVAVVGIADRQWGEVGIAFVEQLPGSCVDVGGLEEHCRSRLAGYKVPARFVILDALPRTSLDKADKVALRRMASSA